MGNINSEYDIPLGMFNPYKGDFHLVNVRFGFSDRSYLNFRK